MSDTLYNARIMRLKLAAEAPARRAAPQGSATKVSPICGSKISVDIDLNADGVIAGFGQDATRVCTLGQAAATLVADAIIGTRPADLVTARAELADWLAGRSETVPTWPGMDVFAPARPHRARHPSILLAFDAAIAAAESADAARTAAMAPAA
jgi:NifU-like protein involved in Fe-S cluster formation